MATRCQVWGCATSTVPDGSVPWCQGASTGPGSPDGQGSWHGTERDSAMPCGDSPVPRRGHPRASWGQSCARDGDILVPRMGTAWL